MKISDVTCSSCSSTYEVAESTSLFGTSDRVECKVCGSVLAVWQDRKLRAYRFVLEPQHKYRSVAAPPYSTNA